MALIPWLQATFDARHLFTLSNEGTVVGDDYGNSSDPTRITGGTYSFQAAPVCVGPTHCVRTTTSTNEGVDGAVFDNRNDINGSNGGGNDSSAFDYISGTKLLMFWARQLEIYNVTCMYEQGGGVNNFAFMGGPRVTFQAADAGQDFLIWPDQVLSQKDRAILHGGIWEHNSQHSGSGNRVHKTANGVIQGTDEQPGATANFPGHSGDIVIGNSSDALKTFNENTLTSETVAQDSNMLLMANNLPSVGNLTPLDFLPDHREFFERTVISEVIIAADTVANQQAALDALSGNTYQDVNCAIEIRQATDATDYTLNLNNIQFVQNAALRDIAVQYVGPNTLTIVNLGTSNAVEVSTPAEKDLDLGTTVLTGGGTIVVQNPAILTIANIITGAALNIFDDEDTDPQYLGTNLASEAAVAGTTYQFNHSKGGDDVVVQMIAPGYEEINLVVSLTSVDQTIVLDPILEENL